MTTRKVSLAAILCAMPGTSCAGRRTRILAGMEQLGRVTTFEASRHLDCYGPRARIHKLRQAGRNIEPVMHQMETESGVLHRVGVYRWRWATVNNSAQRGAGQFSCAHTKHLTLRVTLADTGGVLDKDRIRLGHLNTQSAQTAQCGFFSCVCFRASPASGGGGEAFGLAGFFGYQSSNPAICRSPRLDAGRGVIATQGGITMPSTRTPQPLTSPSNIALFIDALFQVAFSMPRDPRSAEYKAGVRAALAYRIEGKHIAEGHALWRVAKAGAGMTSDELAAHAVAATKIGSAA